MSTAGSAVWISVTGAASLVVLIAALVGCEACSTYGTGSSSGSFLDHEPDPVDFHLGRVVGQGRAVDVVPGWSVNVETQAQGNH